MMTDSPVTTDLRDFGYREMRIAALLLNAYVEQRPDWLGKGVQLALNRDSGCVFLTDEDYNTGMMSSNGLEQWHSCPECGAEGFADELPDRECCQAYLDDATSVPPQQ